MNEMVVTAAAGEIQTKELSGQSYQDYVAYIDASPKTVEAYTKALKHWYAWTKEKGIANPKRDDVLAYRNELSKTHTPATVHLYIVALRQCFDWMEVTGLYPNNPTKNVKTPHIESTHKRGYFTSSQCKRLLTAAAAEGKRDYALMSLLLTTGLRTVEVTTATIGDLTTVGDATVLWIKGKHRSGKDEYVKISQQTEDALRDYIATRANLSMSSPLIASESNRNSGKALTTRAIRGIVKKIYHDAGFDSPNLTAHSTRHTAVNLALEAGMPVQEVQQLCRHKSISTTMVYVHERAMQDNKCSDAISKMIF